MFNLFKSLSWSYRKLKLPVNKKALVLDVGGGDVPYPRANVVLDKYLDNFERGTNLRLDRPLIIGDARKMPFKDKAFDFIVASHVLEHMDNPVLFLKELMRVGKAGYIETPSILYETIVPYSYHKLYIHLEDDKLFIMKKIKSWKGDPLLNWLSEEFSKIKKYQSLFNIYPEAFHVRYYWKDKIDYEVVNQEEEFEWEIEHAASIKSKIPLIYKIKRGIAYKLYTPRAQNKKLDLVNLLACPNCKGNLLRDKSCLTCSGCGKKYSIKNGIPILLPLG